MENAYDGILLLDKGARLTSFDVVKKVRRVLNVKKAGHAGTLDPFATGLLIILLGQGTKLFPFLMSMEKHYRAVITLGKETDTLDPTGKIVKTGPVPSLGMEALKHKTRGFIGEIEQVPPMYSAVKLKGKKAYELARKGIRADLKRRRVKVHRLEITAVHPPDVELEVVCSSGTYIRSLAADLGKALGTCAHVRALRRLSIGTFDVSDALDLNDRSLPPETDFFHDRLISLREAIPHFREVRVADRVAKKIKNGYQPKWCELSSGEVPEDLDENHIKLVDGRGLIAIIGAEKPLKNKMEQTKVLRVFN